MLFSALIMTSALAWPATDGFLYMRNPLFPTTYSAFAMDSTKIDLALMAYLVRVPLFLSSVITCYVLVTYNIFCLWFLMKYPGVISASADQSFDLWLQLLCWFHFCYGFCI